MIAFTLLCMDDTKRNLPAFLENIVPLVMQTGISHQSRASGLLAARVLRRASDEYIDKKFYLSAIHRKEYRPSSKTRDLDHLVAWKKDVVSDCTDRISNLLGVLGSIVTLQSAVEAYAFSSGGLDEEVSALADSYLTVLQGKVADFVASYSDRTVFNKGTKLHYSEDDKFFVDAFAPISLALAKRGRRVAYSLSRFDGKIGTRSFVGYSDCLRLLRENANCFGSLIRAVNCEVEGGPLKGHYVVGDTVNRFHVNAPAVTSQKQREAYSLLGFRLQVRQEYADVVDAFVMSFVDKYKYHIIADYEMRQDSN